MKEERLAGEKKQKIGKGDQHYSIQMTISVTFTIITVIAMAILSMMLYGQFTSRMEASKEESSEQLLNQTAIHLESYLRNMRQISDAMYYSVIKDKDLSTEQLDEEMNLLYEANKEDLISIACYTRDGFLVSAAPLEIQKEDVAVTEQKWFINAMDQMENLHFSTPHVQNLFDHTTYRYYWVISLSRTVELTSHGRPAQGVLLVDMNYSSIEQLLSKANTHVEQEYVYLMDQNGEIIYHPRQKLLNAGLLEENNLEAIHYKDGSRQENFQGQQRLITVKTVSYTGWKIVSVVPKSSFQMDLYGTKLLMILMVVIVIVILIIANQLVSARIARPLNKLNESVKEWEEGNMNPDIYIGGTEEVEHLGKTLRSVVAQLRQLMDDIVIEQEEKRKSELDALQSQINPHFLYNTLDSIIWMIEGEKYDEAVFMIKQLASLFRISLSRGKTIISIEDEIMHAKNYMNIQKIRYKNRFEVTFDIDPDMLGCCTVKLILQPLLENAIYYGVECMDEDGEIWVRGIRRGNDLFFEIRDNGLGMPQELVDQLLVENHRARTRGSGVGLLNVHNRIQLRFGYPYGLHIESQPDEGTCVTIHLPAIAYSLANQEYLEQGKNWRDLQTGEGEAHEK